MSVDQPPPPPSSPPSFSPPSPPPQVITDLVMNDGDGPVKWNNTRVLRADFPPNLKHLAEQHPTNVKLVVTSEGGDVVSVSYTRIEKNTQPNGDYTLVTIVNESFYDDDDRLMMKKTTTTNMYST